MKNQNKDIFNSFDIWSSKEYFKRHFKIDENDILRGKIKDSVSNRFHKEMPKGALLRELTKDKFHQINWETPHFEELFRYFLEGEDKSKPILDLGCGDGRFTETFLNMSFEKIVCLDSDYRLLESLHNYSTKKGFRNRLCIIHSDADEIHFKKESFNVVLAIGVLYYLKNSREKALSLITEILNPKGILVLSEPEIESILYRSLIFDSLSHTLDIFENRIFKEGRKEESYKFAVQSKRELLTQLKNIGFEIEESRGITFFHNLLRVLFVRGSISEKELKLNMKRVRDLTDFLQKEGSLYKQVVLKCRKTT